MPRWSRWVLGAALAVVVLVVGGTYAYIHLFNATPPPLTLKSSPASSAAPSTGSPPSGPASPGATSASGVSSFDGTWKVASGSQAEYRVNEVLFGQSHTAVGTTTALTGSLTVANGVLTAGTFSADMNAVSSDKAQRDGQFNGRIMNVATYPTATFTITQPVPLAPVPADGVVVTRSVTGNLTLHGTTRTITVAVSVRKSGSTIAANGSIPIVFADYHISNPSFGGVVTTDQNGILQFLINFTAQ